MVHCDPKQFCSTCAKASECKTPQSVRLENDNQLAIAMLVGMGWKQLDAALMVTRGQPLRGTI